MEDSRFLVYGSMGRGWKDNPPASVLGRGLVCVVSGGSLEGVVWGVLLCRKASAGPEKVMGQANSRALPVVASLRHLIPETQNDCFRREAG